MALLEILNMQAMRGERGRKTVRGDLFQNRIDLLGREHYLTFRADIPQQAAAISDIVGHGGFECRIADKDHDAMDGSPGQLE